MDEAASSPEAGENNKALADARGGTKKRFGFIVVAAGSSSRMGQPKQLLLFRGKTLLARTIEILRESGAAPLVVVLGAAAEKIRPTLDEKEVTVVENPHWSEGMGSSIRAGIEAILPNATGLDAIGVTVCDQPYLSAEIIESLLAHLANGKTIACAQYSGHRGVPAIFLRQHLDELKTLGGQEGARRIIRAHQATIAALDLPALAVDLDTPEDYQRLLESETKV